MKTLICLLLLTALPATAFCQDSKKNKADKYVSAAVPPSHESSGKEDKKPEADSSDESKDKSPEKKTDRSFLDKKMLSVIEKTTTLTAYKTDGFLAEDESKEMFRGYEILKKAVFTEAQLPELRRLLTDTSSYLPGGSTKLCISEAAFGFRFTDAGDTTDIMISFNCSRLRAYIGGQRFTKGIDPSNAEFFRLFTDLFPEEKSEAMTLRVKNEEKELLPLLYEVKPKESLWGIARSHNIEIHDLIEWNTGLNNIKSVIHPKDKLIVGYSRK